MLESRAEIQRLEGEQVTKGKPPGQSLTGKISARMRRRDTDIPPDVRHKYTRGEETPNTSHVRNGSGKGLGDGATRRRSGD